MKHWEGFDLPLILIRAPSVNPHAWGADPQAEAGKAFEWGCYDG
nr:MAG TPA: hypothetical protein [Caudoviricetes sp.]